MSLAGREHTTTAATRHDEEEVDPRQATRRLTPHQVRRSNHHEKGKTSGQRFQSHDRKQTRRAGSHPLATPQHHAPPRSGLEQLDMKQKIQSWRSTSAENEKQREIEMDKGEKRQRRRAPATAKRGRGGAGEANILSKNPRCEREKIERENREFMSTFFEPQRYSLPLELTNSNEKSTHEKSTH